MPMRAEKQRASLIEFKEAVLDLLVDRTGRSEKEALRLMGNVPAMYEDGLTPDEAVDNVMLDAAFGARRHH